MGIPIMDQALNRRSIEERKKDWENEPEKYHPAQSVALDSQDDYRTISEKSLIGLYVIQKGRFRYVNSMLSHILGYESSKELIGKSFWELIHPDDRRLVKLGMGERKNELFQDRSIFRVFKKDGTILRVHMGGSTTVYQGKPANIGHLIDITSFKETEKTLRQSLGKYQTIIDEIEDGVAEVDLKGIITFTNNCASRIWGHTMEEGPGRSYRSYVDEKTAKTVYEAYHKVFRTGIPGKNIVYEIIRKDGSRRIVEDSVSLIRDAEGKITDFRTVSRDVTDRTETERELAEHRTRLEAIFASVKDGIITVDPELRIIEANKSTEHICGIAPKEAAGKIFSQCLNQCSKSCSEVLKQTLEKKNDHQRVSDRMRPSTAPSTDRQHYQLSASRSCGPLHGSRAGCQGHYPAQRPGKGVKGETPVSEYHRQK